MATQPATRVPVLFGQAGNGKKARKKTLVLPLDRIQQELGLVVATGKALESDTKTPAGGARRLRGDRDNSIRVWLGERTAKGSKKYLAVPYPAGATIAQIQTFVAKMKNARSFTMPSGRTYPLA